METELKYHVRQRKEFDGIFVSDEIKQWCFENFPDSNNDDTKEYRWNVLIEGEGVWSFELQEDAIFFQFVWG